MGQAVGARGGRGGTGAPPAVPFMLTARAETSARQADLEDTVRRLQAFERAGADVCLHRLPDLAGCASCARTHAAGQLMVGMRGKSFALAELAAPG